MIESYIHFVFEGLKLKLPEFGFTTEELSKLEDTTLTEVIGNEEYICKTQDELMIEYGDEDVEQ